ncbi:hypothetical protein NHX12_020913 [Muraenolepis orangiensis]|uniref:Uncharacterized protein n=1 Tax=Muraenolepis orangiensis TaxID=630683 RepID=A0A9Q0EXW8_9TELE|nr:hypothetical protein NHX12_020913 [Muraenolepis orangiensis]
MKNPETRGPYLLGETPCDASCAAICLDQMAVRSIRDDASGTLPRTGSRNRLPAAQTDGESGGCPSSDDAMP